MTKLNGIIYINPKEMTKPIGPYSYGTVNNGGRTLYVSGMTGRDAYGSIVGIGNAEAQAAACFENVRRVAEECNTSLENVLKLTLYIKDWRDYEGINVARKKYWKEPYPASTTITVNELKVRELLLEVDAVIAVPERSSISGNLLEK